MKTYHDQNDKPFESISYDKVGTMALNQVNLTINRGKFVAVMGPSGCGKSALLNIIGLLDKE